MLEEQEEEWSFAEGLKRFNTKGALIVPVRLNKRMKEILLQMIEEDLSKTSIRFEDDVDDERLGRFLSAMTWMIDKLTGRKAQYRFDAVIAYQIWAWSTDNKYHHLSGEKDFEKAMQWVCKQWNSKFAQSRLMEESEKIIGFRKTIKIKK